MKGSRKLAFGLVGLLFLAGGFAACIAWPAGAVVFAAYATGVVGVVSLVMVGNVGEHLAQSRAAATAQLSREELEKRVAAAVAGRAGGAA